MWLCVSQLHQYQYYSTGLLSTHDPFYEQQRQLLGPKKKKIKDEKKFKGKKGTKKTWRCFYMTGKIKKNIYDLCFY